MTRRVTADGQEIVYELVRTARRSVECRVNAEGVRVFAPKRAPTAMIDAFVASRAMWIAEALARLQSREAARKAEAGPADGSLLTVYGEEKRVEVRPGGKARVLDEGPALAVYGTDGTDEAVQEVLKAFLKERAREVLSGRVALYAEEMGCQPARITIREQRTRWGSCSSEGNLNFNWKLILTPPRALDYVVIHELCHMKEFNHSPAFWAQVERRMPDYRRWKKALGSPQNWF